VRIEQSLHTHLGLNRPSTTGHPQQGLPQQAILNRPYATGHPQFFGALKAKCAEGHPWRPQHNDLEKQEKEPSRQGKPLPITTRSYSGIKSHVLLLAIIYRLQIYLASIHNRGRQVGRCI